MPHRRRASCADCAYWWYGAGVRGWGSATDPVLTGSVEPVDRKLVLTEPGCDMLVLPSDVQCEDWLRRLCLEVWLP